MNNAYFRISLKNARKFLESLPEAKLNDLYDLYNVDVNTQIKESITLFNNEQVDDSIGSLAAIISDDDLYKLGYTDDSEDCSSDEEDSYINNYSYSIDDVVEFLTSLDEDTLYDLHKKYDAVDVNDLAIAITDAELYDLGFDKINFTDYFQQDEITEPDKCCDYNYDDCYLLDNYEDGYNKFDFFEDVDYAIPIIVIDPDNYIFGTHGNYNFESIKSQLDPNLVCSCDIIDYSTNYYDDDCLLLFKIKPIVYPEQIQEEVIINSELNPALFDNDTQILKPDVQEKLMDYVEEFIHRMSDKSIDVSCSDIQLIGSNAGYLYTPESDIDIHFIWSYPMDKDNFDQMRAEFVDYTTENPLEIGGYMVELNLEDGINMEASSKRRYSIVNNNWVNNSNTEEVYTADDLTKVEGYEDLVDKYSKRIDDVIKNDSYADAVELKNEIRSNRSEDLANIGSLSMGNVVFKELRNNGKFGELREFIKNKELAQQPVNDE